MKHNRIIGICSVLLCLFIVFVSPLSVFAEQAEGTGSLTVSFLVDDKAFGDISFHVYYVADEEKQPVGAYTDCGIVLKGLSADELGAAADTLAAYTESNEVPADQSEKTNSYGYARFEGLEKGVYLVVGETHKSGGISYSPLPFLVSIPSYDTDGKPLYAITASPKCVVTDDSLLETTPVAPSEAPTEMPTDTPAETTAETISGTTSETTTETTTETTPEGGTSDGGNHTTSSTLPQTGQLWWPVPILLFTGAVMISIGILISRKSKSNE